MEALLLLIMGGANILCFFLGARVGQAVRNGERLLPPAVGPLRAVQQREQRREAEREQERIAIIRQNIDIYDGTSTGQQDVPWGGG